MAQGLIPVDTSQTQHIDVLSCPPLPQLVPGGPGSAQRFVCVEASPGPAMDKVILG
jgi:hypothetical protein